MATEELYQPSDPRTDPTSTFNKEKRRDELLRAIEMVIRGLPEEDKANARTLLRATAYMENDLGYNYNAWNRTYTNSMMSLDEPSLKDLFDSPVDENGVPTGSYFPVQNEFFNRMKELGYNSEEEFRDALKEDDPVAATLGALYYYKRQNKNTIPQLETNEQVFNLFKEQYNKGGFTKYQDEKKAYERFLHTVGDGYVARQLRNWDQKNNIIPTFLDTDTREADRILENLQITPESLAPRQPNIDTFQPEAQLGGFATPDEVDSISSSEVPSISSSEVPSIRNYRETPTKLPTKTVPTLQAGNSIDIPETVEKEIYAYGGDLENTLTGVASTGLNLLAPGAGLAVEAGAALGDAIVGGNETKFGAQIIGNMLNPMGRISSAIKNNDIVRAIPIIGDIKATKEARKEAEREKQEKLGNEIQSITEQNALVSNRMNMYAPPFSTNALNQSKIMAKGGKIPKKIYAKGGVLNEFRNVHNIKGPRHEQGGVPLGKNIEVEGGEVRYKNFIFSDRF